MLIHPIQWTIALPVRRAHSPGGASYFLFLSRQCDVIASFSFGAWRVKTCFLDKQIFCSTLNATVLFHRLSSLEVLSTTMSSPGQRRGSSGHAMAGFDSHSKCARCRDKGLGDDPCVQKKECAICRGFTPEQTLQLSTPTYRDRKDKKATASSFTPTLVDPAHVSVLGKVEKVKAVQSTPTTAKTMKRSESSNNPIIRNLPAVDRVASRMRFPRDSALIRLQTRIFLESAVTKLYENA